MRNLSPKEIFFYIVFLVLFFVSCKNSVVDNTETNENSGLNIFETDIKITSDLTYQNFDLETADITGEPLISSDQIISYDTTNHALTLSFSRDSLKTKIGHFGVHGKPFIVTLDSQKIYGGWFWAPISSVPCHSVVIMPDDPFDSLTVHEIRIKLGYPSKDHFEGSDPRKDRRIIQWLMNRSSLLVN